MTALCMLQKCLTCKINCSHSACTTSESSSRESSTLQWLKECEHLISGIAKRHPTLYYHLSVVAALSGERESSRSAWKSFMDW